MEYDVVHGEMTTITDTEYYTPGNIPFKRTRIITERYNNNFQLGLDQLARKNCIFTFPLSFSKLLIIQNFNSLSLSYKIKFPIAVIGD